MLFEAGVLMVLGAVLLSSEGRSIGDANAVSFPNHGNNYQDYGEQQEYAEQQGEVDRQARDIQENGMESYQPQKDSVRDIRDSTAEEVNTNVGDAAYQSRVNGDDDVEQQPLNNEVGMNRRMDERGMKKEVEALDSDANEQRDMAEQRDAAEPRDLVEQRDEGLRQNPNIEQAEAAGGDTANFRPPRDNGANQALKEVARTEMVLGNAGDVGYEGAHGQAAGRSNNEATYNGVEQERNYNNYNYVQDTEGAGEGGEPQQQGIAANEENMGVPPAQYEQAVN